MKKKALFLDRDGVINKEKNYVYRIQDFYFIEGIFDLLRSAQDCEYLLIVITNQAGIARGYYTEDDFYLLTDWMKKQLHEKGIVIDRVYHCPYHPVHGIGRYKRNSECRKPSPGMILKAAKDLDIDLSNSLLIGDKESDIEAGLRAGIGLNILLRHEKIPQPHQTKANKIINVLAEAVQLL